MCPPQAWGLPHAGAATRSIAPGVLEVERHLICSGSWRRNCGAPGFCCGSDSRVGGWQSSLSACGALLVIWEGGTAAGSGYAELLPSGPSPRSPCMGSCPTAPDPSLLTSALGHLQPQQPGRGSWCRRGILHPRHLKESWCTLINPGCFFLCGSSQPREGAADVGSELAQPQGYGEARSKAGAGSTRCRWVLGWTWC